MRRFQSAAQVQRFLPARGPMHILFRVAGHHLEAIHHRLLGERAFTASKTATHVCRKGENSDELQGKTAFAL